MKFSIIVSVYNAGKYLNKCLESISDQMWRGYEVISVDNVSAIV